VRSIRGSLGGQTRISFFAFQDIIMAVTGILLVIMLLLALQLDKLPTDPGNPQGLTNDLDPDDADAAELDRLSAELSAALEKLAQLQNSRRENQSPAEVEADIRRLENQIARALTRVRSATGEAPTEMDADLLSRIAEIRRLRDELAAAEEKLREHAQSGPEATRRLLELEQAVKAAESKVLAGREESKKLRLIPENSETTKEPVVVDVSQNLLTIMRFDVAGETRLASLFDFDKHLGNYRKEDQYFVLFFRPSGAGRFEELRQSLRNRGFEVGYDAIAEDTELALGQKEGK
jgi:hypothetical protein